MNQCPGQESNLHRGIPYQPLKLARLPVPPPGRAELRFIIDDLRLKVKWVFKILSATDELFAFAVIVK